MLQTKLVAKIKSINFMFNIPPPQKSAVYEITRERQATDTLHEDRPQILYMKTGHRYFT